MHIPTEGSNGEAFFRERGAPVPTPPPKASPKGSRRVVWEECLHMGEVPLQGSGEGSGEGGRTAMHCVPQATLWTPQLRSG